MVQVTAAKFANRILNFWHLSPQRSSYVFEHNTIHTERAELYVSR